MKFKHFVLFSAAVIFISGCCCGNGQVKPGGNKVYNNSTFGVSFEYPSDWTDPVEDANSVKIVSPDGASVLYVFVNSGLSLESITGISVKALSPEYKSLESKGSDQILIEPDKLKNFGADSGYSTVRKFFTSEDSYFAQFLVMKKGTNQYILHTLNIMAKNDSFEMYSLVNGKIVDSFKITK